MTSPTETATGARRDWLEGGVEFHREQASPVRPMWESVEALQAQVETEAAGLRWETIPDDGVIVGPMSPVLMLQATIRQLSLGPVVGYAFGGCLDYPDGPETATYSLLGVEVRTRRQHFRLVLLDTGLGSRPLFIDWLEP